ncbi:MAG: hypothetical protein RRY04_06080 [Oscillospiraceae bacterium]
MNTMNFAKGMGVGLVVGSAIGMVVNANTPKKHKKTAASKALKTFGDIVDSIGNAMSM